MTARRALHPARRAVLHFASARFARKTLWFWLQTSHSARRAKWTSQRVELSKSVFDTSFLRFCSVLAPISIFFHVETPNTSKTHIDLKIHQKHSRDNQNP